MLLRASTLTGISPSTDPCVGCRNGLVDGDWIVHENIPVVLDTLQDVKYPK
jgi:hypothetical protein